MKINIYINSWYDSSTWEYCIKTTGKQRYIKIEGRGYKSEQSASIAAKKMIKKLGWKEESK